MVILLYLVWPNMVQLSCISPKYCAFFAQKYIVNRSTNHAFMQMDQCLLLIVFPELIHEICNFHFSWWFGSHTLQDGGSVTGKNLLFVVFLGCMIVGIALLCLLSKREDKGFNDPLHSSFGAMMESIKDRRMLFIIPLMVYIGLEHAFVW